MNYKNVFSLVSICLLSTGLNTVVYGDSYNCPTPKILEDNVNSSDMFVWGTVSARGQSQNITWKNLTPMDPNTVIPPLRPVKQIFVETRLQSHSGMPYVYCTYDRGASVTQTLAGYPPPHNRDGKLVQNTMAKTLGSTFDLSYAMRSQ